MLTSWTTIMYKYGCFMESPSVITMDVRWQQPFTCMVARPTGCGKTRVGEALHHPPAGYGHSSTHQDRVELWGVATLLPLPTGQSSVCARFARSTTIQSRAATLGDRRSDAECGPSMECAACSPKKAITAISV